MVRVLCPISCARLLKNFTKSIHDVLIKVDLQLRNFSHIILNSTVRKKSFVRVQSSAQGHGADQRSFQGTLTPIYDSFQSSGTSYLLYYVTPQAVLVSVP